MKTTLLGLILAVGLLTAAVPAQAQSNVGIWVGTGPAAGVEYQTYNGYYYYPSYQPGSFQVIYSPEYGGYGWWDSRHFWHRWGGPRVWVSQNAYRPWRDRDGRWHDRDWHRDRF